MTDAVESVREGAKVIPLTKAEDAAILSEARACGDLQGALTAVAVKCDAARLCPGPVERS